MNIGIVTTWFERGAAYVSKSYADILSKKHNIFIFARGGEDYAINDNKWNSYKVIWGKRFKDKLSTRVDYNQFIKWIHENNIEIVIFNEQVDWEIIIQCRKCDVKLISYIDYYKKNTVKLFDLYDALICNTKRHYNVFKEHHNCIYIPWGTDVELFKPVSLENKDIITFFHSAGMGGVNLRKGTDLVVKCFNKIQGSAKLIIHSQAPLERYSSVSDIISNNNNIQFIHKTVPAPGLYHLGDVYVYPSKLEGIGLTIAEALACGLPVITNDCAPMNEFIVNNLNGRLTKIKGYVERSDEYYWPECVCDEEDLLQAMQYFVDQYSSGKLVNLKKSAREYAEINLDWRKNAIEFVDTIDKIPFDPNKYINYKKYKSYAMFLSYNERWSENDIVTKVKRKIYSIVNKLEQNK